MMYTLEDFNYELPSCSIAEFPTNKRDESKLLTFINGVIKDDSFKNITNYFNQNHLLVFNNTKVIPARLFFYKNTGALIEIFCLEPILNNVDYQLIMASSENCIWNCLIGNSRKWKSDIISIELNINDEIVNFNAKKVGKNPDSFQIEFSWNSNHSFAEIIENAGNIPLPPYIKRKTNIEDKIRYQTIYAKNKGSVAAPTAGLHFTNEILNVLLNNDVITQEVSLHVGAGTFMPIKVNNIENHTMHSEQFVVQKSFLESLLLNKNRKIIAVGTTSVRTIESIYALGIKILNNEVINPNDLIIGQWEIYELKRNFSKEEILNSIIKWMNSHNIENIVGQTKLIIMPDYNCGFVNGIITNFHQPSSTLLLLISSFIGDNWKRVYQHALDNNYRFLSYGDSCLFM